MPVEGSGNYRRGGMSGSYTPACEHPAQNERFEIYGVSQRKECIADISKVGKYEVCISKPRILV